MHAQIVEDMRAEAEEMVEEVQGKGSERCTSLPHDSQFPGDRPRAASKALNPGAPDSGEIRSATKSPEIEFRPERPALATRDPNGSVDDDWSIPRSVAVELRNRCCRNQVALCRF